MTQEFEENNDIELEDNEELEVVEEHSLDQIKALKAQIKLLKAQNQEYLTGWQRAKADSVNARKNSELKLAEIRKTAASALIEQLLSVLDSFSMATENESWKEIDPNWRGGVESIQSQLLGILKDNGLQIINPLGEDFDPYQHEALGTEDAGEEKTGKISKVIQKGYALNEKLLRPSRVITGE